MVLSPFEVLVEGFGRWDRNWFQLHYEVHSDDGIVFKLINLKFFLGKRGKSTTHLMALQTVNKEDFVTNLPNVLKRLNEKILQKINDDPYVRT